MSGANGIADLLKVNQAVCVKCGLCASDCAFGALKVGDDGYPKFVFPDKCMRCQHCFAICPKGAIKFGAHAATEAIPVRMAPMPKAEEVENWIRLRRSIRKFRDEDVDRGILERILRALGNVPTGCNARSLTFTCIASRSSMDAFRADFVKTIASHRDGSKLLPRWLAIPAIRMKKGMGDMFFRGAPGMLIVSSDERNPAVTTPKEDIIAALTYFEMLAEANGIGTCWCGFLDLVRREVPEIIEKTLGLRRESPSYAMLFGYPKVSYARGVVRDGYMTIDWR